MVEKTYHIAPYLGAFRVYLMPQWPLYGYMVIRCFHVPKRSLECGGQLTLSSIWSKKTLVLVKNDPNRLYGWENLPFISIFIFIIRQKPTLNDQFTFLQLRHLDPPSHCPPISDIGIGAQVQHLVSCPLPPSEPKHWTGSPVALRSKIDDGLQDTFQQVS